MNTLPIIFLVFLLGLAFVVKYPTTEAFEATAASLTTGPRCADLLVQEGSLFYLVNTTLANVPGVNPLVFNNLEEYVEFTEWQRSQGIICPVLYLQQAFDTQNNEVYKARPSPTDMHAGFPDLDTLKGPAHDLSDQRKATNERLLLDAGRDDHPYNINSYPAFDPQNQDIGVQTPLDKMFNESDSKWSPNPMDDNWGGAKYTDALVEAGYYKDREVVRNIG